MSGTIDLRTGELLQHDRRDLLTKVAPVYADPKAKCPLFKKLLRHATGGDVDLARYIQKAAGYTLTGNTSEQSLFFVYGPGNTGKSTLVNTLRNLMGDYGVHTPTETLLVKQYDSAIPADLARLAGVLAVAWFVLGVLRNRCTKAEGLVTRRSSIASPMRDRLDHRRYWRGSHHEGCPTCAA
jgi:putative DNA primase/helicase